MLESDYMPPIHKNQHYELFVMSQGLRGDGITLLRSKIVYIPNALPCDRVEIKIVKILKSFCYGKLTRILAPSQQRRTAPCPIAAQCGGCTLQHQKYPDQLAFKQGFLDEQLMDLYPLLGDASSRSLSNVEGPGGTVQPNDEASLSLDAQTNPEAGGLHPQTPGTPEPDHVLRQAQQATENRSLSNVEGPGGTVPAPRHPIVAPIIASPDEFNYRNKLQIAIQRQDDEIVLGLYAARSHRVVPMYGCGIQGEGINRVLETVRRFLNDHDVSIYDEGTRTGTLRHLMIREARATGELMVTIVSAKPNWGLSEAFAEACLEEEGVVSVQFNHNPTETDEILGGDTQCLAGRDHMIDEILGKKVKVSLRSFMQANALMVEPLYKTIIDFADLKGSETVVDAYCGAGALTLAIADTAKAVIGVEESESAIADALSNRELNHHQNCEFVCDTVESWIGTYDGDIDVLVVDPPRSGCKEEVLQAVCNKKVAKVVYSSCNPKTFARDAEFLIKNGYQCRSIQPFDLFPQTAHIELVAVFNDG